jgi:hypothetical protein
MVPAAQLMCEWVLEAAETGELTDAGQITASARPTMPVSAMRRRRDR